MRRHRCARAGTGSLVLLVAMGLQSPISAMEASRAENAVPAPVQAVREPARTPAVLSEDRIIAIAEKRYSAKVVRVEAGDLKGKSIYMLRLLSKEGKVRDVKVDAETGGEL